MWRPDAEFRSHQRSKHFATLLPVLHVNLNRVDRQDAGREQLLALFSLR
jgi:hypothetical protein